MHKQLQVQARLCQQPALRLLLPGSHFIHRKEVLQTHTAPQCPHGPATHERARVKWKRWRRPRKVIKERAGKLRVVTRQ